MAKSYQEQKEIIREQAQQWQAGAAGRVDSWEDIARATAYFEQAGRKYGLLTEFKENGIL